MQSGGFLLVDGREEVAVLGVARQLGQFGQVEGEDGVGADVRFILHRGGQSPDYGDTDKDECGKGQQGTQAGTQQKLQEIRHAASFRK